MEHLKSTYLFQIQSTVIVMLMMVGLYFRNNRKKHVPTMLTVIIWDILLVLQIELSRNAVEKAVKVVTNPLILNIHVLLAVSTVLLYFSMMFTGKKILKGENAYKKKHKFLGLLTVTFRLLTYMTSFFAA